MALKDMLVHVDHSEPGQVRLRLAADLAARHKARLMVLHVREHSFAQQHRLTVAEMGLVPAEDASALDRAIAGELDADQQVLRTLLEQLTREKGLDAEWYSVSGHAAKLVIQHSRCSDLTIVGHDVSGAYDQPDGYSFAEAILFSSGRPLLIIPADTKQTTLGREVVVAWNGSRPAARAVSDALPLIEQADHTIVLVAGMKRPEKPASLPTESIVTNLGRHTANVRLVMLEPKGFSIGDMLQLEALTLGADMLVAGAYGHPRLWEKMLGGVTQDLLTRMRLPILMSH